MAYRIEAGETVNDGLKRVVTEELAAAARQLMGKGTSNRDEAVHEARKSVKKIRGVLRLIEPDLGDTFDFENVRMRNIGRRLSRFRDAAAMIETVDALREKYRGDLGRHTLGSVRRGLLAHKKHGETNAPIRAVLERVAAALSNAERSVRNWPIGAGFRTIAPGLEKTFRQGRKAMTRAHKHPSAENYHEWRKRAKDQWYQIRLLEPVWNEEVQGFEKHLKQLEGLLGDYHNAAVLREKVKAEPELYGREKELAFFMGLLDRYREELRESALSAGKHIYEEKPRHYVKRIRRMWVARLEQRPSGVSAATQPSD